MTPLKLTASVRPPLPAFCSWKRTSMQVARGSSDDSGGRGRSAHHLMHACLPNTTLLNTAGALISGVASPGDSFASAGSLRGGLAQYHLPFLPCFLPLPLPLPFILALAFAFDRCCVCLRVFEIRRHLQAVDRGMRRQAKLSVMGTLIRACGTAVPERAVCPAERSALDAPVPAVGTRRGLPNRRCRDPRSLLRCRRHPLLLLFTLLLGVLPVCCFQPWRVLAGGVGSRQVVGSGS